MYKNLVYRKMILEGGFLDSEMLLSNFLHCYKLAVLLAVLLQDKKVIIS